MSKKITLKPINFFNDKDFDPNKDDEITVIRSEMSKSKHDAGDDVNRYLTQEYKIKVKSQVVRKDRKKIKVSYNRPDQPTSSGAPPHHGNFPNIRNVGVAVKVRKLATRESWQDDAEKHFLNCLDTAWYNVKDRKRLRVNRRKVEFKTSGFS